MNISSILRIESRTSSKNFNARSVSFYVERDELKFLMDHEEVLLVHIDQSTEEVRRTIVDGFLMYSQLKVRSYNTKPYLIYRY